MGKNNLGQGFGDKRGLCPRDRGVITPGEPVDEAWHLMYQLIAATAFPVSHHCLLQERRKIYAFLLTLSNTYFHIVRKQLFSTPPYGIKNQSACIILIDPICLNFELP